MNRRLRTALLCAGTVLAAALAPAAAQATTDTFDYTGGVQTWTVPAGVTSATFDLYGAEGATAFSSTFGVGGKGGRATATLSVTPGQSIQIRVGGMGGATGGFNGGGLGNNGTGGGGGGTDVRIGGSALTDRALVAGGGGGSGACSTGGGTTPNGGDGGGLIGGDSGSGPPSGCIDTANTGKGGTQSAGGAGGAGASPGTLGVGGDGTPVTGAFHGGGGGGFYGGGGGTFTEGGGGGSGFGPSGTTFETGVRSGDGQATVTYTIPQFDLTTTISGTGAGHVTSTPVGIDCRTGAPAGCSATYDAGTQVTLTANADPGSTFTGWSGAGCSGAGPCVVTIGGDATATATFTLDQKPDEPPVITSLEVTPSKFTPGPKPVEPKKLGAQLKVGLSESASVRFRVRRAPVRQSGNPGSTARVFTRDLAEGESSLPFSGTFRKTLKAGTYQVIAVATDSAGQRSEKARAEFEIR